MYHCEKCNRDFEKHKSYIGHCGSHNRKKKEKVVKEFIVKEKIISNQYLKAKNLGIEFVPSHKEIEGRKRRGRKVNEIRWSKPGAREEFSRKMKEVVIQRPDSYSTSNVSGRTKLYDKIDSHGNLVKLKGKWELWFAEWLDRNSIKWTNKIKGFEYQWEGSRTYFPDFYLLDYDRYVEIKGYERLRDKEKWKVVQNLIIIKKDEILQILNNTFNIAI